jgi:UDP-glucose 4-epimerase
VISQPDYKGSPVLVTGGAGFIGSHLVDALIAQGARVTVVDNLLTGRRENVNPEAAFRDLDIRNREGVLALFEEACPRFVFHFAAQSSVKVSVEQPYLDADINILGGVNILDGAREAGAERVIFSSTGGALYGEVPEGQLADESWPMKPMSPYAASKAAFEHILSVYDKNYGLKSAIFRFANVYGPRQDPHGEAGVVAIFSDRLLRKQPVTLYAMSTPRDDGCIRDYVYVQDVVEATLLGPSLAAQAYNVATGVPAKTKEILDTLARKFAFPPMVVNAGVRPGDLERSVLSGQRLINLNWCPKITLQEGLARTADWFGTNIACAERVGGNVNTVQPSHS